MIFINYFNFIFGATGIPPDLDDFRVQSQYVVIYRRSRCAHFVCDHLLVLSCLISTKPVRC